MVVVLVALTGLVATLGVDGKAAATLAVTFGFPLGLIVFGAPVYLLTRRSERDGPRARTARYTAIAVLGVAALFFFGVAGDVGANDDEGSAAGIVGNAFMWAGWVAFTAAIVVAPLLALLFALVAGYRARGRALSARIPRDG